MWVWCLTLQDCLSARWSCTSRRWSGDRCRHRLHSQSHKQAQASKVILRLASLQHVAQLLYQDLEGDPLVRHLLPAPAHQLVNLWDKTHVKLRMTDNTKHDHDECDEFTHGIRNCPKRSFNKAPFLQSRHKHWLGLRKDLLTVTRIDLGDHLNCDCNYHNNHNNHYF